METCIWFICLIAIIGVCELGAWVIACELYRRHRRLP